MTSFLLSAAVSAGIVLASSSASAQDAEGPARPPPSIGYRFEAGVASTHLVHGAPKYDTKSTPATEDVASVRVKDLGPGTLQAGTSFALALASTTTKHAKSEEIVPNVTYASKLGRIQAEGGMRVWLYPRMDQVRQDVEGIARLSIPNRLVTPTLEVYPTFADKQGFWGHIGAERSIDLKRWFSVKPRLELGAQGYDLKSEKVHAQEIMVSLAMTALLGDGFFAALRPAYATLAGPSHLYADPSLGGRSVAYLGFAVGAQR